MSQFAIDVKTPDEVPRVEVRGAVVEHYANAILIVLLTSTLSLIPPPGWESSWRFLLIPVGLLMAWGAVVRALYPACLEVAGDQLTVFESGSKLWSLFTSRSNVKRVDFDGHWLRIVFHDVNRVQVGDPTTPLDYHQSCGAHFFLENFSVDQIEELRGALGLTGPPDDEPIGRIEQFYRNVLALNPRTGMTHFLVFITFAVFNVMFFCGVSLHTPWLTDMVRWGANFGPLTTGGEWWRLWRVRRHLWRLRRVDGAGMVATRRARRDRVSPNSNRRHRCSVTQSCHRLVRSEHRSCLPFRRSGNRLSVRRDSRPWGGAMDSN